MICGIEIDGVDKTGKDLISSYVDKMSNHRYVVGPRGILSMITYNEIYNRGYDYTKELEHSRNNLIVYLYAEKEDLEIRHKLSREPKIDIERDLLMFGSKAKELDDKGFNVLYFNTSKSTPYVIAKQILEYMEEHYE